MKLYVGNNCIVKFYFIYLIIHFFSVPQKSELSGKESMVENTFRNKYLNKDIITFNIFFKYLSTTFP